ncbi:MAG: DEAD/DEAH box helicase family protein [Clostridia bacterium]|nr:DEAD/DEAH box helicase family protein [Clostridia bacterium]
MPGKVTLNEFLNKRPDARPMIYAYEELNPEYAGLLKIGYTVRDVEKRVAQQYPTKRPDGKLPYKIVFSEPAMREDGSCFTDHDIHNLLKKRGIEAVGGEWFKCGIKDLKSAMIEIKTGVSFEAGRVNTFSLRPEQREAVNKTIAYYKSAKEDDPERTPKFLWNAKMRFGKTFAAYELAKKMDFKKVLILTFKPAVEAAWEEDLLTHTDFEGWQFISNKSAKFNKQAFDMQYEQADKSKPIVVFGSFQDLLGTTENGGIKPKNEFVHTTNWDLVIFDEYHFGAWRDNAKNLFKSDDEDESFDFDIEKYKKEEADNAYNESWISITTGYYLFLSGTPFRALNSGEFIEEQIYNWTYSDEQRAKAAWGDSPDNPYAALPRMVMLTYRIPDSIRQIAMQGEFNEFDLNVFFSAKGKGEDAKFKYENEVQKWLNLIRGAYSPTSLDNLKAGVKPPMPFTDVTLQRELSHTFWFLPDVASCFAMYNLLRHPQNKFYHDYEIVVCAGTKAGIGVDALPPVRKAMGDPLKTKTITLSCGKLTTGVTVKPWTGIFMLRNLKSPETYFQAAFRVQSPWAINGDAGEEIIKRECYVFDFALDRALKQISSYSCQLNVNESNPEKNVAEFISFLPVLAYDGSTMKQIDAQDILDISMSGTSATLLARRWESALLVNVDNETLSRLLSNPEALAALQRIEGFRSLNSDIETIINKSDAVKKAKKEKEGKLTEKEKKELSDEEKEYKSKRKEIQEKLIKFATRIPIFMYLTDYRESSLKDVITQLEPGLFKKVTGLEVKDFELLCSIGVFNSSKMNECIYSFKRYEESSLNYTGINRHEGEDVGGWDTVVKRKEYEALFANQQSTMEYQGMPEYEFDEEPETVSAKPKTVSEPKKEYITDKFAVKEKPVATEKPKTEEKPEMDLSWVEIGCEVYHKKFGLGTVESVRNGLLYIKFSMGEKSFQFPQAFHNGFLHKPGE